MHDLPNLSYCPPEPKTIAQKNFNYIIAMLNVFRYIPISRIREVFFEVSSFGLGGSITDASSPKILGPFV